MGRKLGRGLWPLCGEVAGSPSNTVAWAETRGLATSIPSGILNLNPFSHLATTDMHKIGGAVPLWGMGHHLTQCGHAEAYLHAKFHLDLSNRLATIHQRYRQTDNGLIA